MKYVSTRGGASGASFSDVVMAGLGANGGLFLPDGLPDVTSSLKAWQQLDYRELACRIFEIYTDMPPDILKRMVIDSYVRFRDPEVAPVNSMGELHVVELFHGPTLAFKDIALQFLGNLFEYMLGRSGENLNIVAATSGDTGSAAIHGVRGRRRMAVFVMHPEGRISRIQQLQMTSVLDRNVFNIAVQGTFDDCQAILKTLLGDRDFKQAHELGVVNSINWTRVLAQIVYYFYAAFRVMERTSADKVRFAVPTGNFGDIFAAYLAMRMGLPVAGLILATNENDILARFFNTGIYSRQAVHSTLSPSMDIQVASNFERYLYYRLGQDPVHVTRCMQTFADTGKLEVQRERGKSRIDPAFTACAVDSETTLATIRRVHETHGYLVDPHTAVGIAAARQCAGDDAPVLCLATAHPAKFPDAVMRALEAPAPSHPVIEALRDLPTRCDVLPASVTAVHDYISTKVQSSHAPI